VGAAESLAVWSATAPVPRPGARELASSLMTLAWSGLAQALPEKQPEA
jgi:hypothetical protein